jgi:hypothetical protein
MESNTEMEHVDDSIVVKTCPYEMLAYERKLVMFASFNSMAMKCDECLEEKPQSDDICTVKTCPLFFMTLMPYD